MIAMAKYIKREAAMDIFGDVPMWQGYYEPYPWEVYCAIVGIVKLLKEEISKIPAADVAPVVHGRWKASSVLLECQNCGEIYSRLGGNGGKAWNYCPNCGARMDGGTDG